MGEKESKGKKVIHIKDWPEIRNLIETAFNQLPNVQVLLYEPKGTP
jgi:hypothetical protein